MTLSESTGKRCSEDYHIIGHVILLPQGIDMHLMLEDCTVHVFRCESIYVYAKIQISVKVK